MSADPDRRDSSFLSDSGVANCPNIVESLVDAPTIALVVVDPDETVQWIDESTARYFGLDGDAGVGDPWTEFLEAHVDPVLEERDRELSEGGTEVIHILPEGDREERWLRRSSTPVSTGEFAGGRLVQFVDVTAEQTSARNVSEQRQRERRYEALVENFPNGAVTLVDEEMRYQLAGGQLFRSLPETPADLEGTRVGDVRSGDRQVFVESYRAALGGEPATVETSIGERVLVLRTFPVFDDDGQVRAAIGMTQDITDRKRRADELRWKSRALDEAPVGVTITDPQQADNPMIYANQEFADLSGYEFDALLGRNCRFMQGEETDPETVNQLRAAIDEEQPVAVELRNYRADGTEFWNQLNIAPVRDEAGTVVNYVGFQQDVTDRKRQERKLRDVNQLLDIALTETGTGIWILEEDDDAVRSFGTTTELFGFDSGPHSLEAYFAMIHPGDRPLVEAALDEAREHEHRFDIEFRIDLDGTERWVHSRGAISENEGRQPRMVGVVTDITDRKQRVKALEKRERVLNELHTATREFYPPGSLDEIAEFLVEFTENAFDTDYVSVNQYDEETGRLEPSVRSGSASRSEIELGTIPPGSNPIWESYRTGETRLSTGDDIEGIPGKLGEAVTQLLVAPVGDFGVLVAVTTAEGGFAAVDVDLVEVLTANADSAFQRLRSDEVHSAITAELSAQQSRVTELTGIIDSVQAVQRRLADSDSQDALETGVCEELFAMDRVDFVWFGRPTGEDTDLSPRAWMGDAGSYLDSVLTDSSTQSPPAQRAAADHTVYSTGNIASRVFEESWAKDALSHEFSSVVSAPLVYDDVLYGVLTVYSQTEDAFDGIYEDLFRDVASLIMNYSRILDRQQVGSQRIHTELEFELSDSRFPLQRLATATESTIRFDTVAERDADHVRVLVTVVEGDAERVLDRARSMTSIDAADWFGDTEHSQLSLLVRKPFLESLINKHGGQLQESVTEGSTTTAHVELPANVSQRPIFDSLTSQYQDIELVAKRQRHSQATPDAREIGDMLTDRQYEILNAAFHGGYYETPRRIKGAELAESFDISGPAVYNHLQAAHRTLLETMLESAPEINE